MILGHLARTGKACPIRADGGLPRRAGEDARAQGAAKGRFYAPKSFATDSGGKSRINGYKSAYKKKTLPLKGSARSEMKALAVFCRQWNGS